MRKLLVLLVALAGCLGGSEPMQEPEPPAPREPEPAPPEPGPAASASLDGFVRDAGGAVAGAGVRIEGTTLHQQTAGDGSFGFDEVPPGRQVVRATYDGRNGSVTIDLAAGDFRTVFIDIGNDTVAPPVEAPAPGVFVCPEGNVTEPHATFGSEGDLSWAVLKTGFRAVVAWEGGGETLSYSVNGQSVQTASSASRIFVLDGLPEGGTLCFHNGGDWHAVALQNAMHAHDGVYTANFLLLANERTNRNILEKGVQRFADLMWDASDGHVRLGAAITVFDHYDRQQEALQPCWNSNPGVHVSTLENVLCDRWFDIIFTHNVNPAAAGATYTDGIQDPNVPVWMNAVHEAGMLSGLYTEASQVREVGSVLTHEVGHYMYGAQDLYPEAGIVSSDCYQASTGISIMSSSRDATEFDSKSTPCSGASSEYRPTWSLMMQRFPAIPEREGPPLDGPQGDGGTFQYATFTVGL